MKTPLILLVLTSITSLNAAVLVGYDFGPSFGSGTLEATTELSGVSGSDIVVNNVSNSGAVSDGLGFGSVPVFQINPPNNTTNVAEAVANDTYFSFTVTPDALMTIDLTSLTFNAARGGGSAPRGFAVRSSLDAFTLDLLTEDIPTVRPDFTPFSVDLTGAEFDNLTTATEFRIYIFSPLSGNSIEFDDLALNGDIATVPEPSALALFGLGFVCFVGLRRRN